MPLMPIREDREVGRAIRATLIKPPHLRTPRERFLFEHYYAEHVIEARDNHDHCSCGKTFWRPNHVA